MTLGGARPGAFQALCGRLQTGEKVETIRLVNSHGLIADILSFGATLQRFIAPDRDGEFADILLGHDDWRDYVRHRGYFGVTVGRYANRIAGAAFELDGVSFPLEANEREVNSLHGGSNGLDQRPWTVERIDQDPVPSVRLTVSSDDGEGGFPGNLEVVATYALNDENCLSIEYEAVTDAPTVVNLTNHTMFNLAGNPAQRGIANHQLTIAASHFLPIDANSVPTGQIALVADSLFDFRTGRRIGEGMREGICRQIRLARGYDHTFVLDGGTTSHPRSVARMEDRTSGRALELLTTEPGLQLYSGNFLDGTIVGKGGQLYRMGDGLALEAQRFPNGPNEPGFPNSRLDPGSTYRARTELRVSVC